jgi:glycosyltransferase involved in cell wall biosynthesis
MDDNWPAGMSAGSVALMSADCQVSVVMSVYNDEATISGALQSILTQRDVDLECIVVVDGSSDSSREIAERFARTDRRIKLLIRENRGLTQSLIEGCALARGDFIARQDADDLSLPGRLHKQLKILKKHPEVALVGCGTRVVTSDDHELYCVFPDVKKAMEQVAAYELTGLRISHGSAMFRRSSYESVGGYRREFYFAQDVDLWIRLFEVGQFESVDEILYELRLSARGISSLRRAEQIELTKLALNAARARRTGLPENDFLSAAAQVRPPKATSSAWRTRLGEARGLYFFGACLLERKSEVAKHYFKKSLKLWPFQIRSWYGLVRTW